MKAPIPYNNRFDQLMDHALRLSPADRLTLIRHMQQRNLDETLSTSLSRDLDDKVNTLTLPTGNNGGES